MKKLKARTFSKNSRNGNGNVDVLVYIFEILTNDETDEIEGSDMVGQVHVGLSDKYSDEEGYDLPDAPSYVRNDDIETAVADWAAEKGVEYDEIEVA